MRWLFPWNRFSGGCFVPTMPSNRVGHKVCWDAMTVYLSTLKEDAWAVGVSTENVCSKFCHDGHKDCEGRQYISSKSPNTDIVEARSYAPLPFSHPHRWNCNTAWSFVVIIHQQSSLLQQIKLPGKFYGLFVIIYIKTKSRRGTHRWEAWQELLLQKYDFILNPLNFLQEECGLDIKPCLLPRFHLRLLLHYSLSCIFTLLGRMCKHPMCSDRLENKRPALLHGGERGGTKRMGRTFIPFKLRQVLP